MKKFLILLLCLFVGDSFGSGIASNSVSAPCTNNTLETYSGNSNLSADWQPNEIQLRWYNNNTLMDVQSAANTCIYDDALNVPSTAPTRTGYTFAGWTVRPEMDFATIPTNVHGTNHWAIGWYNDANVCWYDTNTGDQWEVNCNSDQTYNELQTYEWKVRFEHGDLYGMGGCSTIGGTWGKPGTPTIESGKYCWCKATGYKPNSSNIVNSPLFDLPWVFRGDGSGSPISCAQKCATGCARNIGLNTPFRAALFTPASN